MDAGAWIALGTGSFTGAVILLGSVIGATRYFTQLQSKISERRQHERYADLDAKYQQLLQIVANVQRVGSAALVIKDQIDTELRIAMDTVNASASSVLAPGPSPESSNFVFVSVFGPAAANLRRSKIPINQGIAGFVFTQGKTYVTRDTRADERFFDKVDRLSKYETRKILCVPLHHEGRSIGVAQFLNRKDGGDFDERDRQIAEQFAASLSPRVADFIRDPENFRLLGISPEQEPKEATILFADMTASSVLLRSMDYQSAALDLISDYVERQCGIVLQYRGTVDKYLGDGTMIRFNVPLPVDEHILTAVNAALHMQRDFEDMKNRWLEYGLPASKIYNRLGMACGPVYEAVIGHPQIRQEITVMGEAVSLAKRLCEMADRNKSIIVIDHRIYTSLEGQILAKPLPRAGNAPVTYELLELKRH